MSPSARNACRRSWTLAAVAALAALALPSAAQARPVSADKDGRPNILVVMTDDQALADVAKMPNVRRLLAARGTTFADAVDSFPLCCPSRATFITGQYAHNHGVAGNFYPYGWYGMKHRGNILPAWLQTRRLPHGADRQVAQRLRRARRPRRGPGRLQHLARAARRVRLRLLQLRDEPERQAQDVGRRRLRAQARQVREHRGDAEPRRARRRVLAKLASVIGPRPLPLLGIAEPQRLLAGRDRQDHRGPRRGASATRRSRSSSGGRRRRRIARTSRRR